MIRACFTSAALLAAAAIACAAPASADTATEKFLDDLHAQGYNNHQDATMLYNGAMVCSSLRSGMTRAQVLSQMLHGTTLNPQDNGVFAALAVTDLCPVNGDRRAAVPVRSLPS